MRKTKVGIIHQGMELYGGAEHVCFNVIKTLHDAGHKIGLCATTYPDVETTRNFFGFDVNGCISYFRNMTENLMPFSGAYQKTIACFIPVVKMIRDFKPDALFVTQGIAIVPKSMLPQTKIIYVHFPLDQEPHTLIGRGLGERSRFTLSPYALMLKFIVNTLSDYHEYHIITNSKYTAGVIKRLWGKNATVIYPPCPLYLDIQFGCKKNQICTISRFTPEKRLEMVIRLAKTMPQIDFHIVGGASSSLERFYLEVLMRLAPRNVYFHVNASVAEKMKILSESKVYVHAMRAEHFGIAIIEAESAGCVPVVHDSGAARFDNIVSTRFRWKDGCLREKVELALKEWTPELATKISRSTNRFSQEVFKRSLLQYVACL